MLTTSAEYKAAITATTRSMLVRANISGIDVDPRYITRVQITEDMTRDDQLGIGAAPAAVLEPEMRMPSPAVALAAAEIKIYYDLKTVAGTETIPLGVYIAAEVSSSTGYQTINIKAYDRMAALGAEPYSTTVTTWPASAEDIAADICAQNGLDIADGTAWPAQEVPQSISEAGYTAREVIGFIAGMAGKNAHIDRAGALTLKGFRPAGGGGDKRGDKSAAAYRRLQAPDCRRPSYKQHNNRDRRGANNSRQRPRPNISQPIYHARQRRRNTGRHIRLDIRAGGPTLARGPGGRDRRHHTGRDALRRHGQHTGRAAHA